MPNFVIFLAYFWLYGVMGGFEIVCLIKFIKNFKKYKKEIIDIWNEDEEEDEEEIVKESIVMFDNKEHWYE